MRRNALNTSGVVSVIGRSYIHCLTTHKASRNGDTVEFSRDLIREIQNHLRDILDLADTHFKAGDHDGSGNLRSNAIMAMTTLFEIHRTLAGCKVASTALRQQSRSKCGELLSEIALTAQKVVVVDGKFLSHFIVVCIDGLSGCVVLSLAHAIAARREPRRERPRYYGHRFTFDRHFAPLHRRIRRDIHAYPFPDHIQRLLEPL